MYRLRVPSNTVNVDFYHVPFTCYIRLRVFCTVCVLPHVPFTCSFTMYRLRDIYVTCFVYRLRAPSCIVYVAVFVLLTM